MKTISQAIVAAANGDSPGHEFRGNQFTSHPSFGQGVAITRDMAVGSLGPEAGGTMRWNLAQQVAKAHGVKTQDVVDEMNRTSQLQIESAYAKSVSKSVGEGASNVPGEDVGAKHAYASRIHNAVAKKAENRGDDELAQYHRAQSAFHAAKHTEHLRDEAPYGARHQKLESLVAKHVPSAAIDQGSIHAMAREHGYTKGEAEKVIHNFGLPPSTPRDRGERANSAFPNMNTRPTLAQAICNGYNPDQERDAAGRWTSGAEVASETEGSDKTQRALDLTRHARTSGRSEDVLQARQAHESALARHRAKAIDATTEGDRHLHQVLADVHARVLQGFAVKDGQHSYDPARVPLYQGPGGVASLHAGTAARLHDEAMVADTKLSGTRLYGSEARAQEHEKVAALHEAAAKEYRAAYAVHPEPDSLAGQALKNRAINHEERADIHREGVQWLRTQQVFPPVVSERAAAAADHDKQAREYDRAGQGRLADLHREVAHNLRQANVDLSHAIVAVACGDVASIGVGGPSGAGAGSPSGSALSQPILGDSARAVPGSGPTSARLEEAQFKRKVKGEQADPKLSTSGTGAAPNQDHLDARAIHLGALAHKDFKRGKNPAGWAVDEDIWAKAKDAALKSYSLDDDAYWPVVAHVYESMGGTVKGEAKANVSLSAAILSAVANDYHPDQARDEGGKWTAGQQAIADRTRETAGKADWDANKATVAAHTKKKNSPEAHEEAADLHEQAAKSHREAARASQYPSEKHVHTISAEYHDKMAATHREEAGRHGDTGNELVGQYYGGKDISNAMANALLANSVIALGNTGGDEVALTLADIPADAPSLANAEAAADGWLRLAPFGDHPHPGVPGSTAPVLQRFDRTHEGGVRFQRRINFLADIWIVFEVSFSF